MHMHGPLRLSSEDRAFFAPVGRAIFMNPFSEEREAVLGRVSAGHAGEAASLDPRAYAFVTEVNQRLDRLDRSAGATLQQFDERDRGIMQPVLLYQVYHRYVAQLDALIHDQLRAPGAGPAVEFAHALIAEIRKRGFTEEQSLRYFAIFYQLRRAFFFILGAMVGDSPSMRELRRVLWNSVFTHDIRNYDRGLWNRM